MYFFLWIEMHILFVVAAWYNMRYSGLNPHFFIWNHKIGLTEHSFRMGSHLSFWSARLKNAGVRCFMYGPPEVTYKAHSC